ncbi:unnamed protein product [Cylicocyclus nassatus]|uniref:Uncharacterized protein n=1 Tax=Cylicocyclus nassatus TaxID=53992 RepID=A0AA36H6Z4_CYLNA|nr:unnamed protein product [Cylicocyclus nassatus]
MYRAAVSLKRKFGGPQTYAKPRPVSPPCLTGRENPFVENIVEDEGAPSDIQMELEVPQGRDFEITAKSVRRIESSERSTPIRDLCVPGRDACISVDNCVKFWQIQANPPFKKLDLTNLCSLNRFLFQRMTEPADQIKSYSIRLNQNAGRDEELLNLPEEIERILRDFGEDMMGFGHEELDQWRPGLESVFILQKPWRYRKGKDGSAG